MHNRSTHTCTINTLAFHTPAYTQCLCVHWNCVNTQCRTRMHYIHAHSEIKIDWFCTRTCLPTFFRASCSGVIVLSSSRACIHVHVHGDGDTRILHNPHSKPNPQNLRYPIHTCSVKPIRSRHKRKPQTFDKQR